MKRGTSFHHWTRQGFLSMSEPWQRFPSPRPTVTGLAWVCSKRFLQCRWAQYLCVQHLTEDWEIRLWAWHGPGSAACRSCQGLAGKLHGSLSVCREPPCSRKACRQAWDLTFRAVLWTDNKSDPESGLGALLRTDFPPSCGSLPQTTFESGEQECTRSS